MKTDITKTEKQVAIVDTVFLELKKEMDTKIDRIKKLRPIKDKAGMETAESMAKDLNSSIKNVTSLHKTGKEPYLAMCRQFDLKKNQLNDPAEEALGEIKENMMKFQKAEQKKADEERDKIEQTRIRLEKEAEEKQLKVKEMSENLQNHISGSLKSIHQATLRSQLKEIWERDVILFRTKIEADYPLLQDAAHDVTKIIVKVGQMKDNVLKQVEGAKKIYDEEIIKYLGEDSIALKEVQEKVEEVAVEIQEVADVKDSSLIAKQLSVTASQTKGVNIKISWEFELEDWKQVPEEWKALNEGEIESYIAKNKPDFKGDSFVVNGVKFIKREKAGLKR